MTPKKGFTLHGNNAIVDPANPEKLTGAFATNLITDYNIRPNEMVDSASDESVALAKEDVDERKL